MFKPSPVLAARLRLTTKQVNGGYYKGNRTGSMGAHTEYGGYIIDYRKVRHFNCPDLTNFQLTPFVTQQMEPTERVQTRPDGTTFTPKFVDGMEYLQQWRIENLHEYDQVIDYQRSLDEQPQPEAEPQDEAQPQLETQPQPEAQSQPVASTNVSHLDEPATRSEQSTPVRSTALREPSRRRRERSRTEGMGTSGLTNTGEEASPPTT